MVTRDEIAKMHPMVRWFDPSVLLKIIRPVIISSIFGSYADSRLIQAALDESGSGEDLRQLLPPNSEGEVWFDFIADTGDGFDSTYAIAWLQAQPQLTIGNHETKRGQLLILGGDQVYPDASRENYDERFKTPFEWAWPDDDSPEEGRPRIYAIPGNHDWYDGLHLFLGFFCGMRAWKIGKRRANQKRSYFSLQIANGVWIWGVDIQLTELVDKPQAMFFERIAASMPPSSTIIICTAVPGWYSPKERGFNCLGFFSRIAREARKDLRVPLVLSGDVHHYSRYVAEKDNTQFVTAGGGGAFLHPTHILRQKVGAYWNGQSQWVSLGSYNKGGIPTNACYPPMATSRKLLFGNLFFPLRNWKVTGLLGGLYSVAGLTSLMWNDLGTMLVTITNPIWWIWVAALLGLYFRYADSGEWTWKGKALKRPKKPRTRKTILGLAHGLAHVAVFTLLTRAVYAYLVSTFDFFFWTWAFNLTFIAGVTLVGGFCAALMFGMYLLLTCIGLSTNANDAFSSLSINGYKNFLRLRLKEGKLTIYPIGVPKVPRRSQWIPNEGPEHNPNSPSAVIPRGNIRVEIIEPPIEIAAPPR